MSKRLRVSTVLMASIMFVSATLTGCSGGDTAVDTNKETGAVGEDIAVDKKDEKPTNLIWYTVANEPPTDLEKVQAALNEYTLEKINTTIDITTMSYADYNEKMPVMINSGEAFDICFTSSGDNPYVLNASRGAFVDLTPYLENEGKEMYDAIDEKFWEGITVDGQIFAVPTQKELPWAPSLKFSTEIIEKASIELPEMIDSLDVLEPLLAKAQEAVPETSVLGVNKNGLKPVFYAGYDMHASEMVPAGTTYTGDIYKVINPMESEFALEFAKQMRAFYEAGYVPADAATNPKKPKTRFVDFGHYQPYAEQIWERSDGYPVTVVPVARPIVATTSTMGSMHAVSITSQNPGKAVAFLNLLNTDPYVKNLLTYGIEGEHYEKTGDNSIKFLDASANYRMPSYTLGNHFIGYTVDPDPVDKWEKFKEFNTTCEVAPLFGFSFDGEPVKNQLAAVKNVSQQYYSQVFTGSVADVEGVLKVFNEKLYQAGLQAIMDEMQSQIDAFISQ
ncbi:MULTISPECIES: ABC transporter substrate-binding protein [Bacillota]|uniref:ABC transporter substrate-binding protein n=1 Tax=Bacillota TaxID=1239 RepID=UPI002FCC8080